MSNVSLRLVVVKTQQLEVLRSFYATIGLPLVEERHGNGPLHYSATLDAIVLEIYPLTGGVEPDRSTRLGFAVSDLDQVCDAVRESPDSMLRGPMESPWGRMATAKDPDGRTIELYARSLDVVANPPASNV